MATFTARKKPKPIKIENFLGINEAVGETEVKPGEWISGFNARVTKDFKMQKRPGHHTFINFGSGNVQAIWYGEIADKEIMLTCWNGNVYEYDMTAETSTVDIADLITEGTVTIIGTIADVKTCTFWFNDKIYFMNGTDYKEYDGTTYQDVVPYVPTIALNAPPTGGGTLFEEINLLTGQKKMTFVGDGSSTTFVLPEQNLDSIDAVNVDGTPVTYTPDLVNGQITGVNPTPANQSEVEVTWTKVVAGNADLVKNHKYAVDFGVNNDTNLFIFGNPNEKHVFRFSGINKANYFPANSFVGVGSTEFAITDLQEQYQSLLVFKEKATYIVNPTENADYADNTGLNPYNFGYAGLNEKVGNSAPNMVQLIRDTPVSMYGFSFRQFISNRSVRNEVEPLIISDRLKLSLQILDLSRAVTFDYEFQKELWVNVSDKVYIWNYGNDTMYKYDNIQATEFIDINGILFYAGNGTVEQFKDIFTADGQTLGDNITMKIYGGFLDFNALEYRKMMRDEWVAIKPDSQTSVSVTFVTDRVNEESSKTYLVEYKLMDFNNIDFNDFSFLTNRSAQAKRIKGKVKKFVYLQWVMENDTNDETLTVLKLLMQCMTQGYSR